MPGDLSKPLRIGVVQHRRRNEPIRERPIGPERFSARGQSGNSTPDPEELEIMSPTGRLLQMSIDQKISEWWDALTPHEQCIAVADLAEELGLKPGDFRYAIEKPWKWKKQAWQHAHGLKVE